jgi:hypothetical protein
MMLDMTVGQHRRHQDQEPDGDDQREGVLHQAAHHRTDHREFDSDHRKYDKRTLMQFWVIAMRPIFQQIQNRMNHHLKWIAHDESAGKILLREVNGEPCGRSSPDRHETKHDEMLPKTSQQKTLTKAYTRSHHKIRIRGKNNERHSLKKAPGQKM